MFHLKSNSNNRKTGPIHVSTSPKFTCPDSCELKGSGCLAEGGPLLLHWNKVTRGERGVSWESFLKAVRNIPKGSLWRHNVAGDLVGNDDSIDSNALMQLVRANKGKKGFTYTHYPVNKNNNLEAIREANSNGFTVNVSCNGTGHAAKVYKATALPVVTVLPTDAPNDQWVDGVRIVACPADKTDKIQCINCGLCADSNRKYVIGFRAHGTRKKKANEIALRNI